MKRILSLVIIVLILLNNSGCAVLGESAYTILTDSTIAIDDSITEITDYMTDKAESVITVENADVFIDETRKEFDYILNTNSMKFHFSYCGSAGLISKKNKLYYFGSRDELIAKGYSPCGNCHP